MLLDDRARSGILLDRDCDLFELECTLLPPPPPPLLRPGPTLSPELRLSAAVDRVAIDRFDFDRVRG